MKSKFQSSSAINYIKWILVLSLIFLSSVTNSYYDSVPLLYRVFGIIALVVLAGFIFSKTSEGSIALQTILESRKEIRRVIWPSRSETTSTSFIVLGVVTIAGLLLWGLDSLFSWATASILG